MKKFLIVPMGGVGRRFLNEGYQTYKPFLSIDKKKKIFDKIVDNFDADTSIIVVGNKNKIQKYLKDKTKIYLVDIKNHKKGPLFSLYLAQSQIKKIVKNHNIFICYSDIIWKWKFNDVLNKLKEKKSQATVFTHTGFHPHLEFDQKSDFCIENNENLITKISQKKINYNDYTKELLATGCYYFEKWDTISTELKKFCFKDIKNKEYYMVSLINKLMKKIKINHYLIEKFAHLGTPNQYNDYLKWQNIFQNHSNNTLGLNYTNIMLMGGKGSRVKKLNSKKPFLKIFGQEIYSYIFKKFGSKNNIIITNQIYSQNLLKKYKLYLIAKTNSMLSTMIKSISLLQKYNKYFLTSCDCYGIFKPFRLKKFIKLNKPDIIIFAYKFSNIQRKLKNSHTELIIKKNEIIKINVKKISNKSNLGHAGFFWINSGSVFYYLNKFKNNEGKLIKKKREIIIDDYLSYLVKNKLFKIKYFTLDDYMHIGSVTEYKEFNYWQRYFYEHS